MIIKKNKGFTLIEVLVAIFVMLILSSVILSIVQTSGKLYRNVYNNYDSQTEARVAMSYITVKLRRNDVLERIEVDDINNVLKIINDRNDNSKNYEIKFENNVLKEKKGGIETVIAEIDSFEIEENIIPNKERVITIRIGYVDAYEANKNLEEDIALRCID